MTTEVVYYWEHASDDSRYIRSNRAADVASLGRKLGGEVGVIVDHGGDRPLSVVAVATQRTVRETARLLAATGAWLMSAEG